MRLASFALVLALTACAAPARENDPGDAGPSGAPDAGAPDAGVVVADACAKVAAATTDPAAYTAMLQCLRSTAVPATKTATVGRFVRGVESRGGFPIVDGEQVVWVYVHDATWDDGVDAHGGALRVAGDFNRWQPSVALADEGQGFEHVSLPLAVAGLDASGAKYKLVTAGDTYFADPLARRFQYDQNGEFSLVRGEAGRSHLERMLQVFATKLGVFRPIYLYLPVGYEASQERYPVLYMHDGQNLFDPAAPNSAPGSWDADAVADEEIAAGRARPFVIVGVPNNAQRFDEYTWTQDDLAGQPLGGRGADYADFLVHDLKPLVDARYRTRPGRDDTGVVGSSLGGLISYEVGLAYPDVFGMVGGLSSTFAWGTLARHEQTVVDRYQASNALATSHQRFYLDSGGGAPNGCPGDPENDDNYCATQAMQHVLEGKGYTTYPDDPDALHYTPADANILHWFEAGAPHNEAAWHLRLFRVLRLFLRP